MPYREKGRFGGSKSYHPPGEALDLEFIFHLAWVRHRANYVGKLKLNIDVAILIPASRSQGKQNFDSTNAYRNLDFLGLLIIMAL